MERHVDRLPFAGFKDDFTVQIGTFAPKVTQVHDPPGDHAVYGVTVQQAFEGFKLPCFNAASRFERPKIDFSAPFIIPPKITLLLS